MSTPLVEQIINRLKEAAQQRRDAATLVKVKRVKVEITPCYLPHYESMTRQIDRYEAELRNRSGHKNFSQKRKHMFPQGAGARDPRYKDVRQGYARAA